MEEFSIGEMTHALGMTPGAIYHYEKEGIILTRKKENGWRYYTEMDFLRVISARKYRAMGFSISDIADQFTRYHGSVADTGARLRRYAQEAQRQIDAYTRLKQQIEQFAQALERVQREAGEVELIDGTETFLLCHPSGGILTHSKKEQQLTRLWLDHLPTTRISILWEQGKRCGAMMVNADYARENGLDKESPSLRLLPAVPCLHTLMMCENLDEGLEAVPQRLVRAAQERGLAQSGPVCAMLLVGDYETGALRPCMECWMPVRE